MSDGKLRALIEEMRAGLEGVTPGPWFAEDVSLQPDDVGSAYIVAANLGGLVGAAHSWPTEIDDNDFERVEANAAHIARCSPENIALLLSAAESYLSASSNEGWRDIGEDQPDPPHGVSVLLWSPPSLGHPEGHIECRPFSTGRSGPGWSEYSQHSWATHWRPLPPLPSPCEEQTPQSMAGGA